MNSTRTVAAVQALPFHHSITGSPHGRIRTFVHATLDLVDNRPEAESRCPTLVADVVTRRFSNTVTVGSRPGSGSSMSPVVLAQRADDSYVRQIGSVRIALAPIGQNMGKGQSWDTQNVRRLATTIGLNPARSQKSK